MAHYYEQNGDLMADPEMSFEVDGERWLPVSFRQDNLAIDQEAVWLGSDGQPQINAALERELGTFATLWSANLVHQGFLAAARRQANSEEEFRPS